MARNAPESGRGGSAGDPPAAPGARPHALPLAARRHPLVGDFARSLRDRCGVPRTARLLLGVSGGADSLALLLASAVKRDRRSGPRLFPVVGHVDHGLRPDSAADAACVRAVCERLDVPCHVARIDLSDISGGVGNVEEAARERRYAALAEMARAERAPFVAVAHHAEDQLETILMALCRGAGVEGLRGMPFVRPLGTELTLVRPLLFSRRADCESLCKVAGIEWREDPSNRDLDRRRARLRAEVLPVLEELWPRAAQRAAAAAESLDAAALALETEIARVFGPPARDRWARSTLRDVPAAVLEAGLRRAVLAAAREAGPGEGVGDRLARRTLRRAADAIRTSDARAREFQLHAGWRVRVGSREVSIERVPPAE